jgi:hypothetical protein
VCQGGKGRMCTPTAFMHTSTGNGLGALAACTSSQVRVSAQSGVTGALRLPLGSPLLSAKRRWYCSGWWERAGRGRRRAAHFTQGT